MQDGDIASWTETRIIVVFEGVLAEPTYKGKVRKKRLPVDEWHWYTLAVKTIIDKGERLNIAVEVVTFLGPEVAEEVADFMARYDMPVSSVDHADFDWFCKSLSWRPEVSYVVDTDPNRIQRYGQRGFVAAKGDSF